MTGQASSTFFDKLDERSGGSRTRNVTSIDLTDQTNDIFVHDSKNIVVSPGITVLSESDIAVTKNVGSSGITFITQGTFALHFNSPDPKVGRAGEGVGNAIYPKGKDSFREVANHIKPRNLRRHNVVPGSKIAIFAEAEEANPHFIGFNFFHS